MSQWLPLLPLAMSSFDPTTAATNNIFSVLLALKRIRRLSPYKILPHLRDPHDPSDLDYLDALATLCSFAGPCDSVSTAICYSQEANDLYIATSSAPPPTLQAQLAAWFELMRTLPVLRRTRYEEGSESGEGPESEDGDQESKDENPGESAKEGSPELEEGSESEFEDYENIPSIQSFIVGVYRDCHAKLLDVINRDNLGQRVLEQAESTIERHLSIFEISRPEMLAEIKSLLAMAQKKVLTSPEELLSLYRTAKVAIRFEKPISLPRYYPFFQAISDLTLAVDTLVQFATCEESQDLVQSPWNVIWVEVPESTRPFVATTNVDELAMMVKGKWRDVIASLDWNAFEPSASNVRQVEGCPGRFTGRRVMHCESALLDYLRREELYKAVEPYIGCSGPVCYACLMLIRAFRWEFNTRIEVGPRSTLEDIDFSWAYPSGMGEAFYQRLVRDMVKDLKLLATNPYRFVNINIVPHPDCLPGFGESESD